VVKQEKMARKRKSGFFMKTRYSGPPPLVKFRMVRGGPEFLWAVDYFDVIRDVMEMHEV
jgi:hypothetical protein